MYTGQVPVILTSTYDPCSILLLLFTNRPAGEFDIYHSSQYTPSVKAIWDEDQEIAKTVHPALVCMVVGKC